MKANAAVSTDVEAFVRQHARSLFATAYLLVGDVRAAEDLVQDSLVALLPRWHRVEAARSPLAYTRRAMVNLFLTARRRKDVVDRVRRLTVPADVVDPADGVIDSVWVRELIQTLPVRQRAAVVLRFVYDWPDTDIAEALECRPGSVRSLVSRALITLRTSVESGKE